MRNQLFIKKQNIEEAKINEQHKEIESDDDEIPILTGEELKAQIEYEKNLLRSALQKMYYN